MDAVVAELIKAFAPTVADKILSKLEGRKVKREDIYLVTLCMLAEQNENVAIGLDEMHKQLVTLNDAMNATLREIKAVNEGVTVLLKRTSP
jgi:hypothetical protein